MGLSKKGGAQQGQPRRSVRHGPRGAPDQVRGEENQQPANRLAVANHWLGQNTWEHRQKQCCGDV